MRIWFLIALLGFGVVNPVLAGDLLIRFASLERASVPGILQSPNGDIIDTRAIRRSLYGLNFHPGDTVAWNIKDSQPRVYRFSTPTQVLARRFAHLDPAQHVATVMPGQYWFSVGASLSELDATGAVLFVGRFNRHRLVSSAHSGSPLRDLNNLGGKSLTVASAGAKVACVPNSLPEITSALTALGTEGTPFSYTITATNAPTSFNATPLPNGLNIDTVTGVISGTPTVDGVSNVGLSATNAHGTDIETLVLTILLDSDQDGIPDSQDGTPFNSDTDGDGLLDGVDPDIDGDGVPNESDTNAFDPDTDNDGIGDAFDDNPLANNACNVANAIFDELQVVGPVTCAAASSISVSPLSGSLVEVLAEGDLKLISPIISFEPGVGVFGSLTVISADPCPNCAAP